MAPGFSGCSDFTGSEYATRIDTWSQIDNQIGKFPHPKSKFLISPLIQTKLREILGFDYKSYENHLSSSGCGALEIEGEYFVADISQLHVNGYSSIMYFDKNNEDIYLFWLKRQVLDKEYEIYGKRPTPIFIMESIRGRLNQTWGSVANFTLKDNQLLISEKQK